ncbi:hypothetical protein INT45_012296 [Circinella minor]|uniref:Uncharacterized protein n=1 Tax=Circinella minor TaxID=1195481 RepID=A0A8H7VL80_9FUNG|nr:hypothetical protein INT45_012296 [Circinella minor]
MNPTTVNDYINDDNNNDRNNSSSNSSGNGNINHNIANYNNCSSSDYIHDTNNSSNNNDPKPLHPLAAVGYVLMEQKCSLFEIEYKEDPTVMLLYTIAKDALENHIRDHQSTVNTLVDDSFKKNT